MQEKPKIYYEITFTDFKPSDAIRADIEHYILKLEKDFNNIIGCYVTVRAPHKHQRQHIYQINVQVEIPGNDVYINNEPATNYGHSDIHISIRDAFKSMQRKLLKRKELMRKHETRPGTHQVALIKSFDENNGYGFLVDPIGREIYFHKNALLNGNEKEIHPGLKVKFVEDLGIEGNHVSSMLIINK